MYGYTHTHTYTHLYLEVPSSHDDLNLKTFKFDYVCLLCELINEITHDTCIHVVNVYLT